MANANTADLTSQGITCFQKEDYAAAADAFAKALESDRENKEVRELLELATANAIAQVNVPVPEIRYFKREELLSVPEILPGTLPSVAPKRSRRSLRKKLRSVLGGGLGAIFSSTMHGFT